MDRIADYTLLRPLGEGNHGRFFLARPPARLHLDVDQVAVKVIGTTTTDDAFRRATRELRLFASLRSPYLVTLFDAGQEDQVFYYAMEFLPLGSLAEPAQPLDRDQKLRAVADACRAAHDLHEAGIVHRDVKPENVLLHERGGKLSDLGLAQIIAPGLTITGMGPVSSVEYVDPAIMLGQRASRASDIWSLGVTLHRALAGVGVYPDLPDDDPLLAMRRVLAARPVIEPSLSKGETALIESCLAPDPADRPPTAAAVAEGIGRL